MVSGEIPVEPRASWFSSKCVEAQSLVTACRGKATVSVRAVKTVPNRGKL